MKKGFIIASTVSLLVAMLTIIVPILIIKNSYADKEAYYLYLTILIYLTMVMPIISLLLLVIKEIKKLPPEVPSYLPSSISILTILGVISFYAITNFIGCDKFFKYRPLVWIILILDIVISIMAFFVLRALSKKNTPPKIVKRP